MEKIFTSRLKILTCPDISGVSASFPVQYTNKDASRLRISKRMHPGILEQPGEKAFFISLLRDDYMMTTN